MSGQVGARAEGPGALPVLPPVAPRDSGEERGAGLHQTRHLHSRAVLGPGRVGGGEGVSTQGPGGASLPARLPPAIRGVPPGRGRWDPDYLLPPPPAFAAQRLPAPAPSQAPWPSRRGPWDSRR